MTTTSTTSTAVVQVSSTALHMLEGKPNASDRTMRDLGITLYDLTVLFTRGPLKGLVHSTVAIAPETIGKTVVESRHWFGLPKSAYVVVACSEHVVPPDPEIELSVTCDISGVLDALEEVKSWLPD
jgi:hypothetical protein